MGFIRYLYRNTNLLNILLLLTVAALLGFGVWPLYHVKERYVLPNPKGKTVQEESNVADTNHLPSPLDFAAIAENNLFHPDRRVPVEKKAEQLLPKPEIVLYGTIIDNGVSMAYIEDKKAPITSAGRGKRQSVVKTGDVIGGFVLKEIKADHIVLARGDETIVVSLAESGKQREGDVGTPPSRPPAVPGPRSATPPQAGASVPPAPAAWESRTSGPPRPGVAQPSAPPQRVLAPPVPGGPPMGMGAKTPASGQQQQR
jgi:hypothetical protein